MSEIIIPTLSIVAVSDIILGLVVFSRGIKTSVDIIFGLITLTLVAWSISIIGFYSEGYHQSVNWILLTHSSALLISFFFLNLSINFPQRLNNNRLTIFFSTLLLLSLLYLIFCTDLVIGNTIGLTYQLGIAYIYYAFVLILYFMFGFIFLSRQYVNAVDNSQRKQIQYVAIGYITSSSLAIIPDLILPYFNIFQYTWLGPLFALILVASIFIAIFKYQLFQVKIILTELMSIVIIISLLIELFFVLSSTELILKTIVLIIVTVFSYFLINGVKK